MNIPTEITHIPIGDLIAYEKNARTHSKSQIAEIARSMQEFGWTNPVLVGANRRIIAGHGRVLAARNLGLENVPCIVLKGLSDAQERALVIADNRIAQNAGWDLDTLAAELGELRDLEIDPLVLGFDQRELSRLLRRVAGGATDPNAVPGPLEHTVTREGDLWICGDHRVLCGSAIIESDVRRLLGDVVPVVMSTDQPYGVSYDANWREDLSHAPGRATGQVVGDDQVSWAAAWRLFPGGIAYVWHAAQFCDVVLADLGAAGFKTRAQIIWGKRQLVPSRGHYHWQHEPCWYAVRQGATANWCGDRKQSTLWQMDRDPNTTGHSTQKPVEAMRKPIENHTVPGDAVYDPFLGSGTTIIAAEQIGRRCYGLEIYAAYVDVIVRRWQAFAGDQATLDGDGRTFAQIEAERCRPQG